MPGAVVQGKWHVVYIQGVPSLMVLGQTVEQITNQLRSEFLGKIKIEDIVVKDVYETPIDDVIRCGLVAIMGILSAGMMMAGARAQH